jgi:hypothetical protein
VREFARFGVDFSRTPLHAGTGATASVHRSPVLGDKSVDGQSDSGSGPIQGPGPDEDQEPMDAGGPPPGPAPAAPTKRAGVDSFVVKWTKNPDAGPTIAKLRLDTSARFTKDATQTYLIEQHDPITNELVGKKEIMSTAVGQWIEFTTPNISAGTYQLNFAYRTNPTRAQHSVKIDGVVVGGTIDQYAASPSSYVTVPVDDVNATGRAPPRCPDRA